MLEKGDNNSMTMGNLFDRYGVYSKKKNFI